MVCLVNVESVGRIFSAISNGVNDQWRNRTLRIFTPAACRHPRAAILDTLQNSVLNSLVFVIQRITDSKADHVKWVIF